MYVNKCCHVKPTFGLFINNNLVLVRNIKLVIPLMQDNNVATKVTIPVTVAAVLATKLLVMVVAEIVTRPK